MQLPLKIRLKLLRQEALAAVGIGGNVSVAIEGSEDGFLIRVDGRRVHVPSPHRWKLYRKGWVRRLDRLEEEYGIGRHVALGPESIVLDVGANAGEFAYVCERYGARVHCFEPDPKAHACLLRNTNDLENVSAHDVVVWNENGEVPFGLAPERGDSSVFMKDRTMVTKPAITIERFCADNGIARVDFVKCDAEGAEPEVLEGIGGFFPNIRVIALDTGPEREGACTDDACTAILKSAGFTVINEMVGTRLMTYGLRG